MKVLIIEDESIAAKRLEDMLMEIEFECKVLAKIGSVKESVKWLSNHEADLIFLDIQLSDGLSFSIFEQVRITTPIIFTTAYDQYAIKAFQLNSIAYLLKPIKKRELEESLQKYKTMRKAFSVDIEKLMVAFSGQTKVYKERFLIRIGDMLKKVTADEVAYIFSEDKSVYLVTFDDKKLPVDYSLDALEEELDPDKFFRVHRGLIVNIESIETMMAWTRSRVKLELNPSTGRNIETVVSTSRSGDFKEWMNR
ncbi:MAG: response regulator [Bacteroidetes bacterium]|jgi:DNA-binding LytR/AlgR family response regulator|nr:response regulator [Bacteroidota bacterium]